MWQNGHVDLILSANHIAPGYVHEWPPAGRPPIQSLAKLETIGMLPWSFEVSMHTAACRNM